MIFIHYQAEMLSVCAARVCVYVCADEQHIHTHTPYMCARALWPLFCCLVHNYRAVFIGTV